MAGNTLFPFLPIWAWGIIHSGVAVLLIWVGRFGLFEKLMKALVGIMVIAVLVCALLVHPHWRELLGDFFVPQLPAGAGKSVLGIFGGIGGSMTMLCYGYWIRENAWTGAAYQRAVRADLWLAYGVTLVFAVALTLVASGCNAHATQGSRMALEVAARLQATLGPAGRWTFLIGFWCAVFTAMLAVWQGVPYLFADFTAHWRRWGAGPDEDVTRTKAYRGYLLFLAGPPLVLLFKEQPVAMVVLFTIVGACFMPFLAALLLYLNNRRDWIGPLRNHVWHNAALIVALLLFGWIAVSELAGAVAR
jgi:Mn2+/Fe2+ NRAMP family transporter